jgi:hypothetical protein
MDTILGVYDKAWICAGCFVGVSHLVDPSWAVKPCGLSETWKVIADRNVGITQMKMNGLVLFVVCIRKVD